MYKLKELLKEVSLKQITEYAINYWEEHRTLAKADAFSSPAMTDKDTCQKLINLLWELAYQQGDYKASLDTKQRKELKKILEKSNLEKPKFASQ